MRRDERFGYLELPDGLSLDRAIEVIGVQSDPPDGHPRQVRITLTRRFDLRDGHAIDPFE